MDLEILGDENQIMFNLCSMWGQGFPEIFSMDLKINLHRIHSEPMYIPNWMVVGDIWIFSTLGWGDDSIGLGHIFSNWLIQPPTIVTPPKTNMDTQNDGLEKVTPFEHGNCRCRYLCYISGVYPP